MTDQDLELCLDGDAICVQDLVEAYRALRAENAELLEAMQHPSYEVENRLRAELAALREQEPVAWRVLRGDMQYELYFHKHSADRAAEIQSPPRVAEPLYAQPTPPSVPTDELLDLLDKLFAGYENGVPCFEDPEEGSNFVGNAFVIDNDDFHRIADILNTYRPLVAPKPGEPI